MFGKNIFVIEGDIQTTLDAERVAKAGIRSYQINTGPFGGDCHLESGWIKSAIEEINLAGIEILFVENIGNLVCPAEFDVGAHVNTVVLSVTEGEDKPLKYPTIFREAKAIVISKTDLLPHIPFKLKRCLEIIRKINTQAPVFQVSAITKEGMGKWIEWLVSFADGSPHNKE